MPMRVIAGSAKGRRLKMVPGDTTRPVMDRVKEALFSILGRAIIDSTFLDLFAGTGSVGIEALSRGAAKVVFVEMDRMAVQTIQENLKITGLGDKAIIRRANVFAFLKNPPAEPYEYIYIAPPQYKNLWSETLLALDSSKGWIGDDTTVIVQIDPREQQEIELNTLEAYDERKYGKTLLWFFALKESDAAPEASEE
jgi:16S rRNA (guanine966-N2)-methyltransferase